jgi:methionine-gamma-lyase
VVSHRCFYISTEWLLWEELTRFGVEVAGVDACDLPALEGALKERTSVVYLETIANPSLDVPDIAGVARLAHAAGAKLVVDNTFASPYLCRPLACGADIVVESATKYLSGHGDALGGVVAADRATIKAVRWSKELHGGAMSPFNAFLILRGIETLGLRLERQCANAAALARFLVRHPKVEQVIYPGLESHRCHETARRQLRAPGAMVGITLKSGRAGAERLSRSVHLVKPWVSLGDVRSLLVATHDLNPRSGVPGGFVRLSVGAEDVEDIIADFTQALERV